MPDPSDFIKQAMERWGESASDERPLRKDASVDLGYVSGEGQWEPKVRQDREGAGRPVLTFNREGTFVSQVANEARQNKPQIKFAPVEDADEDTAEIYEGLARRIQYDSEASVAYETAVWYSAAASFGYYRFLTEFIDDEGFDVDLKVVPVLDPFQVYGVLYPACFGREPRFAFVVEDIPIAEYKEMYPKSELASLPNLDAVAKKEPDWVGTETVRVAEYWTLDITEREIKSGGKTRTVQDRKVTFRKINAVEVLEGTETEWVTSEIPIIPVLGRQLIIDGKPKLYSVVRFLHDAQKLINYGKTRIAETLATAPISPYIGAAGSFAGFEKQWQSANTALRPYLEYNTQDLQGRPNNPPQRQTFEPPIQSLSEFVAQEIDDLKAISGIFDASLGAGHNDVSGTAIARRQQQSSSTNLDFMDNLERAFRKGGEIIAEAIPVCYDTPRTIRILGADETPKIVKVNQKWHDGTTPRNYQLTKGKYDIVVTVGRSFSTKRMESFDMMTQIIQGNPQLLMSIGDIFFQNSDVAGADQLAERFKKMLPPGLQTDDGSPESQMQKAQSQMAQLQQQNQQMQQLLQQQHMVIETKQVEQQGKLQIAQMQEQAKIETTKMQEATKLAVAQINASKDMNQSFAESENDAYSLHVTQAHDAAMQAVEHAHTQQMAQRQAEQAQMTQQADQQHQTAMAQQSQEAQPEQG